ncbi:unnamed protein product [Oncorhynchus mykiss]|uniref:Major facilitator superfamily (MFS) profile domain-containing protein n=1 Tax=Oncorhynchus mykiss TaxID=8022 RepID=A0A060XRG3_ONCMY|nr:unnamed protein product [Oncorhynchus mykiss]
MIIFKNVLIVCFLLQTLILTVLMRTIGNKNTVLLGLGFQILQLAWYGFGSEPWMMWAAGAVAAMSSITFPAVSALVSRSADPDKQGLVQGMITGIRGLCNGLGPALYGLIFFMFNVELNTIDPIQGEYPIDPLPVNPPTEKSLIPGPPFLLGSCTVVVAFLVALFIPENTEPPVVTCADAKDTSMLAGVHINTPLPGSDEDTPAPTSDEDFEPLLQDSVSPCKIQLE